MDLRTPINEANGIIDGVMRFTCTLISRYDAQQSLMTVAKDSCMYNVHQSVNVFVRSENE